MAHARRDLLRLITAGLGASLVGCGTKSSGGASSGLPPGALSSPSASTLPSPAERGSPTRADVIVIGAGVAGLGAAHDLAAAGKRVIVLEARDRIGGRLATDRAWGKVPIELGAAWIHGDAGNPVTALARAVGAKTEVTTWENVRIYEDGAALGRGDARRVQRVLERVMEKVEEDDGPRDRSVRDALDAAADELSLSKRERLALDYMIAAEIESDYACDASDLSLRGWTEGRSDRGEDLVLPGGYDQILKVLDGGDVRLGHVVSEIAHDARGVRVTTSQGAFTAERALVTLPIGVLRAGSVRFLPELPDAKRRAIDVMRMDVLQKVILRYESRFWPEDVEIFGRLARGGEFVSAVNLERSTKEPMLMFFNAGAFARKVEDMSDAAVAALATTHVRSMFGASSPEPEACLVTRWGKDPYARGAYAHLGVGAKPSDRKALAEPVGDRLFFAGEATEPDFPATVRGALVSGRREAKRLLTM